MKAAEKKRILAECKQLHALLDPLGLKLFGWSTLTSFSTIDEHGETEWTPVHVAALRRALSMEPEECKQRRRSRKEAQ